MNNVGIWAGYISGFLCIAAFIMYLKQVQKGRVSSNKVAWGIWTIVSGLLCISYYETVGFVNNIWVSLAYFVGVLLIFLALCIRSKENSWGMVEKISLVGVFITLIIWLVYKSPLIALTSIMIIDLLGAVPMIMNAYKNPASEHAPSWYMGFSANFVNLLAVEKWDYANATYPIYLTLVTLCVALLTHFPRFLRSRRKENKKT